MGADFSQQAGPEHGSASRWTQGEDDLRTSLLQVGVEGFRRVSVLGEAVPLRGLSASSPSSKKRDDSAEADRFLGDNLLSHGSRSL